MPPSVSQEHRFSGEGTTKVDGRANRREQAAHNYLRQKREIMLTGEPRICR